MPLGRNAELGITGLTGAVEIGRGGYAVVYRAFQPSFDRFVAVKVFGELALDEITPAQSVESYTRATGSNIQGFALGASGIEVTVPAPARSAPVDPATWSNRLRNAGFGTYQVLKAPAETIIDVVGSNANQGAVVRALGLDLPGQGPPHHSS